MPLPLPSPALLAEFLALGAFTGFLAGLLGIGGGMLMVPFVTFIIASRGVESGLAVKMAIATSMATILFTSISSLRAHHKRGAVRWDLVRGIAPGIVVGSLAAGAGAFALIKGAALAVLFAVFVGFSATQMLLNRKPKPSRAIPGPLGQGAALAVLFAVFVGFSATQMLLNRKPKPSRAIPGRLGQGAAGAGIGFLSGLVGAGGAFVSVPFMTWCNVPIHNAVATSAALGFPIALASTVGYVISGWQLPDALPGSLGYLYLPALLCIAVASVSTAPLGARVAHSLDVAQLKRVFAFMLYALAAYMVHKGLTG